jgi:uncharacterized protein (DUF1015 family)
MCVNAMVELSRTLSLVKESKSQLNNLIYSEEIYNQVYLLDDEKAIDRIAKLMLSLEKKMNQAVAGNI